VQVAFVIDLHTPYPQRWCKPLCIRWLPS